MPSFILKNSAIHRESTNLDKKKSIKQENRTDLRSSPLKRRLRSLSSIIPETLVSTTPLELCSSQKWKSPRKSIHSSPNGKGDRNGSEIMHVKSPRKRLADCFTRPKWNPKDSGQMSSVKEALHVSTATPLAIVCRSVGKKNIQKKVLDFCKSCVEEEKE